MKILVKPKLKLIKIENNDLFFTGDVDWINFANNLFIDMRNLSVSDDENNKCMFTDKLLRNYFYKSAFNVVKRFLMFHNIKSDKDLLDVVTGNGAVDFINSMCTIMIDFVDGKRM
jgi:hypothetical protein